MSINAAERVRVCAAMEALGLDVVPTQGNFALVGFHRPAMPVYQALLQQGVIVRPMAPYDLPQHLRITFGTREENDRLLQALCAVVGGRAEVRL